MSTDDCKKFIQSIAEEQGFNPKDKWKRVKRYTQGEQVLRDFENATGDTITIAQDKSGNLSLLDVQKSRELPSELLKTLSRETLIVQGIKYALDWAQKSEDYDEFEDSPEWFTDSSYDKIAISQAAWQAYLHKADDTLIWQDVKNTPTKIDNELYGLVTAVMQMETEMEEANTFVTDISREKIGVIYDKENISLKYKEREGLSYFLMECGGDWEHPVMFYVYWSQQEQRLKGFFPTGSGNVYNQETNTAYGSEYEVIDELANSEKLEEKYENLKEEIYEDMEKIYDKAEKIGFKQFKQHLLNEHLKLSPKLS